jgi:hypothetical protein
MENNCKVTSKPKTLKEFFKSSFFWKPFLAVIFGGLAGFLYFYFVGCKSGSCAITSNPYNSVIFGGLTGFLFSGASCTRC